MDSDAIRRKRQEDNDAKRKRLEELKARKTNQERVPITKAADPEPVQITPVVAALPPVRTEEEMKAETEDLVNSLLATEPVAKKADPVPEATQVQQPARPKAELLKEKLQSFSTVKSFHVIDILPDAMVKYDKSCQTEEDDQLFLKNPQETENGGELEEEDDYEDEINTSTQHGRTPAKSFKSPSPVKTSTSLLYSTGKLNQSQSLSQQQGLNADLEAEAGFTQRAQVKLTDEERARIIAAKDFGQFLQTTSLYMERALALTEEHDVLRDYSVEDKGTAGDLAEHAAFIVPAHSTTAATAAAMPAAGASTSAGASSTGSSAATAVAVHLHSNSSAVFESDALVGRPVMAMQWSPLVPELFLAAYGAKTVAASSSATGRVGAAGKNSNNSSGSLALAAGAATAGGAGSEEQEAAAAPGMVCVWSKDLHSRPEYRFVASSPVLAAAFHSQEQSLVIGGCYSGQILLWDMKLNKSLPVQRSSMSGGLICH